MQTWTTNSIKPTGGNIHSYLKASNNSLPAPSSFLNSLMWQLIPIKNYPKEKKNAYIGIHSSFLEWNAQILPAVLPTSAGTKLNSAAKNNPINMFLKYSF